jgi:type IV secretion system protein VirD4
MTATPTFSIVDRLAAWAERTLDPNAAGKRTPAPPRITGWPGLYLGAGRHAPVWGGVEHHALIIGPPRSGKTTRIAIPNLHAHPGAVVATSTKTDLAEATWTRRAALGTCWLWDPSGTLTPPEGIQPLRWSPVVGCQIWDTAVARAHALAMAARPSPHGAGGHGSELHWIERAQAVLAPLLHAATLARHDLATVLSWLHRRDLVEATEILKWAGSEVAADLLTGISTTDSRELSGIFSTADSLLAVYRTDAALASARRPNFDPDAFAASTDTVYLCAPGTAQAQYAPLVVALLDQIRTAVYRARRYPSMFWALDELANIAPLPDLPATISEGASQGLIVLACIQDLSQARARWGAAADGLLTLFTHKLVLPGIADLATLRQLSALAGEIDVPVVGHSQPDSIFGGHGSTNTSPQRRPRLPVDAIAAGTRGGALWLNRTHPATVALPPWRA